MSDEVRVYVPMPLYERTMDVLEQCAEDLRYEIDARYGAAPDSPTEARRRANDLEPVIAALTVLQNLKEVLEPVQ